jgi:hypothetical protein
MERLGAAFTMSFKTVVIALSQRFSEQGISEDLAEQYHKEMDANFREAVEDMYFVSAQRSIV